MPSDPLTLTFAALADPTRREILARLAEGERSVSELAKPFDMTLPAVSKHLKVLERAGLIERSRRAQLRPARLAAAPLMSIDEWLEHYRRFYEASLDRLGEYLTELQRGQGSPRKPERQPGEHPDTPQHGRGSLRTPKETRDGAKRKRRR